MAKNYSIKSCKHCNNKFLPIKTHIYCSVECRFWSKVNIKGPNECWLWQTATDKNGYGKFWNGNHVRSHRVMWEIINGLIPKGFCVLHRCDTPSCCNPIHLFLGTPKDNAHDRAIKNRNCNQNGENNHKSKLTKKDIISIRILLAKGMLHQQIGQKYGVHKATISKIKLRTRWAHIK